MSTNETVAHAFYDAVLADIVYINLDGEATGKPGFTKGLTGPDLAKLIAPELTKPLADQIGDRFIVLDVKNDPATGYQGVLFKDLVSGDVILANRGTDPSDSGDIKADVDLAALSGVARKEITSMVNWWNDISKPAGTTYTSIVASPLLSLSTFSSGETKVATGGAVAGEIATAVADHQFRVVGHSLGGHLTTVFTSLFHDQVSASSIFNGAGIDSTGVYATDALNKLMKDFLVGKPLDQLADILGVTAVLPQNSQSNYYAENGFSLTTNDWTFSQIGHRIGLENEQSAIALWQNHSMYKLTDLLALYVTLAKLQPDIDIQTLNALAKASSNESVNSLENMLDSVRRFFNGSSITPTPAVDDGGDWEDNTMPPERITFHTNLQNLSDKISSLETLLGKVTLSLPFSGSESQARNDFSVFLSLLTLSPVVIRGNDATSQADLDALLKTAWEPEYQQWHDDINKPDAQRAFTDTYLQDRAKMLSYIIQANQQNILPSTDGSLAVTSYELGKSETWQLSDLATHKQLSVTVNNGSYQDEYDNGQLRDHFAITFGSQSDDTLNGSTGVDHLYGGAGNDVINGNAGNDYLEGNAGVDFLNGGENNDILIGGAGDDTLNGDAGNDYLEGGLGIDTYRIVSGEGTDTILDADGLGYIQWDDLILSGSSGLAADKWKHPGDGVWQDLTNNISYILSPQADGKNQLIIFKGSEKLIVNGWKDGDLNISGLAGNTDAADIPDTSINSTTTRIILGDPNPIDDDPNTAGIQYRYDALGNVIGNGELPGRDDILYGSAGNDAINGLGGNDEIHATQGGNDVIDGGTGNDFIYAGTGQNKIYGGEGSDAIVGGYSKDIIFGDTEITDLATYIKDSRAAASVDVKGDFLAGHSGDDILVSGAKNDTIEGGDGADLIISGAGNDFIDADGNNFVNNFNYSWTFQDTSTDSKPWDTYYLSESYAFLPDGSGDDTVYAGAGNDVAWLGKGNDKAYGGDGNDELYGDEGNDALFGENGDDTLRGDSYWNNDTEHGSDYLDGGDGNDTLKGFGGSDILLGGNGNDTLSGDCAAQEGHYSAAMDGNDSLDGGAGDDILFGDGKDDLLIGGDGNDKLHGDNGVDNLEGQYHGKDQLLGGAGNDSLWGGGSDDQLEGGTGDDYLEGDASDLAGQFHGKDTLAGGDGNDTLFGDGGDDTLSGGSGDDYLNGDNEALEAIYQGNDTLDGGDGNDTLYGGGGNDRLTGGAGDDYMVGDDKAISADATFTGDDVLSGGAGHDYLAGGKGNDVLNGGADLDNLLGGDGDDTYIFNTGDSVPIVNGNTRTVEWIDDLSGNNAISFGAAINQGNVKITHAQNGVDLYVSYSAVDLFNIKNGTSSSFSFNFADGSHSTLSELMQAGLQGSYNADTLIGYDGNDTLAGYGGDDTLLAGKGNDTLNGGDGFDVLTGGEGDDTYVFHAGDSHSKETMVYWPNFLVDSGIWLPSYSYETLNDNEGNDLIQFDDGITLNDLRVAHNQGSTDLYLKYSADDSLLITNSTNYRVRLSDGTETSIADLMTKRLVADSTGGTLYGFTTDDVMTGNAGNDVLFGDAGNDQISGGAGNDQLNGDNGNDQLSGDAGNDTLFGGSGDDTLSGGDGNDTLTDYDGNNVLLGGAGDDVISGQGIFDGGTGDDVLNSDRGANTYIFDRGYGHDTINNSDPDTLITNSDKILLGATLTESDIVLQRNDDDLLLTIQGTTDQLLVRNYFRDDAAFTMLNTIQFGNGAVWDFDTIKHRVLTGTTGNDVLLGYASDDNISAGEGDDILQGNAGNDTLYGDAGNDDLLGNAGDDQLYGGAGNDTITDTEGNNLLSGGAGNDILTGHGTLDGGADNDTLTGSQGADIYLFGKGYGQDTIFNADTDTLNTNADKILFDASITPENIHLQNSNNDLVITVDGTSDSLRVSRYFLNNATSSNAVELLQFSNGTVWNIATVKNKILTGTSGDDVIQGFIDDDIISAGDGNDTVRGNDGNDQLLGGNGADFLDGETGNDTLFGGEGNDTLNGNYGQDILYGENGNDTLDGGEGNDTLYGGDGDDILTDYENSNTLYGGAGNDTLTTNDYESSELYGETGDDVLTGSGLLDGGDGNDTVNGLGSDTLLGGNGNDTLIAYSDPFTQNTNTLSGGQGNDIIYGSFGDDTYLFNLGDGQDQIIERRAGEAYSNITPSVDTLIFGAGITQSMLTYTRQGDDLTVGINNTTDSLTIQNWFNEPTDHFKIDIFEFDDGSQLTATQIENKTTTLGTDAAEQLIGYRDRNDTIRAGAGDDQVWSESGNDTLYGDAGNDYLDGGEGNDVINGGAGNDTLYGRTGSDLLSGGAGDDSYVYQPGDGFDTIDSTDGGSDVIFFTSGITSTRLSYSRDGNDLVILVDKNATTGIRVKDHFINASKAISYVQPDGGYSISATQIAQIIAAQSIPGGYETLQDGTTGADTLVGGSTKDLLRGGAGNDQLFGGGGDDRLEGGDGNDYLSGGFGTGTGTGNDVLVGGAGNDTLVGEDGNDTLIGGTGDDQYIFDATSLDTIDTSDGGNDGLFFSGTITKDKLTFTREGNDLLVTVNANAAQRARITNHFLGGDYAIDYVQPSGTTSLNTAAINKLVATFGSTLTGTTANNTLTGTTKDDQLFGLAGNDTLNGGTGNDVLSGGLGADTLNGGTGNDTYFMDRGDGSDVITDQDSTTGNTDLLQFGKNINANQLWFTKSGNNLVVSVIGTTDKATIQSWYTGSAYHVEQFKSSDGKTLLDSQVANLVSAMASMTPPAAGQTTLPQNYQDQLSAVLAANWK